ncbi:hypothetical protein BD289DRAFT_273446 [Coniella lustricola]|uniref:Uncharacterized protein n=1 Tax=Coniella lustricola TaxID=2025994 RepID=A0A2T3A6S9_9PEZI|nr:hypothetical protein BD289DRAFT_273446 [Coniella lustricola]
MVRADLAASCHTSAGPPVAERVVLETSGSSKARLAGLGLRLIADRKQGGQQGSSDWGTLATPLFLHSRIHWHPRPIILASAPGPAADLGLALQARQAYFAQMSVCSIVRSKVFGLGPSALGPTQSGPHSQFPLDAPVLHARASAPPAGCGRCTVQVRMCVSPPTSSPSSTCSPAAATSALEHCSTASNRAACLGIPSEQLSSAAKLG